MLTATEPASAIQTLHIVKDRLIAAPIDIVFETLLEPHGPLADMKLTLEPFVGGRWFRDLGNNTGHLWGHVQVIKPPKILEITGPMMMSYPAINFIQYRLTEEAAGTRLAFTHQAMGLLTKEHREGVTQGWEQHVAAIQAAAESRRR
jgi:uncharacterized protein YndB with AHSA1/START domain